MGNRIFTSAPWEREPRSLLAPWGRRRRPALLRDQGARARHAQPRSAALTERPDAPGTPAPGRSARAATAAMSGGGTAGAAGALAARRAGPPDSLPNPRLPAGHGRRGDAVRPHRGRDDGEPLLRQPARRAAAARASRRRDGLTFDHRGVRAQQQPGTERVAVRSLPAPDHRAGAGRVADLERHAPADRRRQDGRLRALGRLRRADGLLDRGGAAVRVLARAHASRSPTAGSARRRARPTPTAAS